MARSTHRKLKICLLLLVSLFTLQGLRAQTTQLPCEEPLRVDPFFQCHGPNEPYFVPVCACNHKTYRSECVARNNYGINTIFSDGVCMEELYDYDFYPNPAKESINFALQFFDQGNVTIQIFDTYGKLMYFSHRANVKRIDDIILVNTFQPGMYVIAVISGGKYKARKLIVR